MAENDERMLECARALKEYCNGFSGECTECLFCTDDGKCVFHYYNPWEWNMEVGDSAETSVKKCGEG